MPMPHFRSMKSITPSAQRLLMAAGLALVLAAPARADIGYTPIGIEPDMPASFFGYKVWLRSGVSTLNFSSSVLSQWAAAGLSVKESWPGTLNGASVASDVWLLPNDIDSVAATFTIGRFNAWNGFVLEAGAGASVPGATLEISSIKIVPDNQQIYVNVAGSGGKYSNLPLWTFATQEGSSDVALLQGEQDLSWHFGGLKFTQQGLDHLQRTFQLTDAQTGQLADAGSFDVDVRLLTDAPPTVPEPSAAMLMVLGLGGLVAARRRQVSTRA